MTRSSAIMAFTCMLLLLGGTAMAEQSPRLEISLSGGWFVQKADDLSAPPQGDWKPFRVPGYLAGGNYERAWLKRTFSVEAAWSGKRLKLHFGGVKYNSVIIVNGRKVGGNFGGYEPFDVDVTDAVKPGAGNELLVGVHDWTGVFSEKVDLSEVKEWHELRSKPKDKILSPIGGIFTLYGIWEDVALRVLPPVYVQDVFVKTSVRKKRIEAEVTVANEDMVPREVIVKGRVTEAGLELSQGKQTLKPGESQTVTLSKDWPDPKLWTHLSPNLYDLKITLQRVAQPPSAVLDDACATRFGFREFWAKDDRF